MASHPFSPSHRMECRCRLGNGKWNAPGFSGAHTSRGLLNVRVCWFEKEKNRLSGLNCWCLDLTCSLARHSHGLWKDPSHSINSYNWRHCHRLRNVGVLPTSLPFSEGLVSWNPKDVYEGEDWITIHFKMLSKAAWGKYIYTHKYIHAHMYMWYVFHIYNKENICTDDGLGRDGWMDG